MNQGGSGFGPMEGNKTINVSYHNTLSFGCRTTEVGLKMFTFLWGVHNMMTLKMNREPDLQSKPLKHY